MSIGHPIQHSPTFGFMKWHISFSQKYGKHLFFLWTITNSFKKVELCTMMNRQLNLILLKLNIFLISKTHILFLKKQILFVLNIKKLKIKSLNCSMQNFDSNFNITQITGLIGKFYFQFEFILLILYLKILVQKLSLLKKRILKKNC